MNMGYCKCKTEQCLTHVGYTLFSISLARKLSYSVASSLQLIKINGPLGLFRVG